MSTEKMLFADKETGELIVPNPRAVKTPYNAHQFPKYQEENTMPSMTVPDQTMSVAELLDRHRRGLPVHGDLHPIYHGEEEMPDLRRMDLSEIDALRRYNEDIIYQEEQKRLDAEKARRQKENEDFLEQQVQLRLQQKEKENAKPSNL